MTSNLNGYYMDGKRLALVRSFYEGLSALYFDSLNSGISMVNAPVRLSHSGAGAFKPITLAQAIATKLNETELYVRQVARCPLVARLEKEPNLALTVLDPGYLTPGVSLSTFQTDRSLWLKGVRTHHDHPDKVWLSFTATFTYYDKDEDEQRELRVSPSLLVPFSLLESFKVGEYKRWLKGETAKRRAALVEHVNKHVAEAKAILS